MANTTSGTTTFGKTFAIDDIVEEAYERIGIRGVSGYQLKTARRSLNILFQEWANRGVHLWEIGDGYLTLVAGTNEYIGYRSSGDGTSTLLDSAGAALYSVDDVFEASYRSSAGTTSQSDSPLTKISRSTYSSLSNKLLFKIAKKNNYISETSKNFEEAIKTITTKERKVICVFGSLYLCGNILNKN